MAKNRVMPEQRNKNFNRKNSNFFKRSRRDIPNKKQELSLSKPELKSVQTPQSSSDFFVKPSKNIKSSSSSRNEADKKASEATKRPFDKRKWRLRKYSKKYKLEQWEEKRKKTVLREYYKQIKDDENKYDIQKIYDEGDDEDLTVDNENENNLNADIKIGQETLKSNDMINNQSGTKSKRKKAFQKAHLEYERIKEEKKQKKEEFKRKKAERDEALKQYKEKKITKFKVLSRKTRKGQPIMKDRMEMLLAQIQDNLNKEQ